MCCIVEIASLVFGIMILVKGRFALNARKEVRGGPAYLVGLLLVAIFPIALVIGVIVGIQQAQKGGAAPGRGPFQIDPAYALIDVGVVLFFGLAALIVALTTAKPKRKKKRRRLPEEEDYDDYDRDADDGRPRRRRYEHDELDEDDDRPRRRRDDYDDDDRPRRRDDLDDRAR